MSQRIALGIVLQSEGLLTEAQCKAVLAAQLEAKSEQGKYLPFGELVLSLKLVTIAQLRHALELQRALLHLEAEQVPLASTLLEERLLSASRLNDALKARQPGERFEAALVRIGAVPQATLAALAARKAPTPHDNYSDAFKLKALKAVAGGKEISAVCRELNIPERLFAEWLHTLGEVRLTVAERLTAVLAENRTLKASVRRLALELRELKEERLG